MLCILSLAIWRRGLDSDGYTHEKAGGIRNVGVPTYPQSILDDPHHQRRDIATNGKTKRISFTIKKRKLEYLGHIMRHDKYRIRKKKRMALKLTPMVWTNIDRVIQKRRQQN